jgi:hypothetical protein
MNCKTLHIKLSFCRRNHERDVFSEIFQAKLTPKLCSIAAHNFYDDVIKSVRAKTYEICLIWPCVLACAQED